MEILLILFAVMTGLPVLAYLTVKFGTAGYLRAKRRDRDKQNQKHE